MLPGKYQDQIIYMKYFSTLFKLEPLLSTCSSIYIYLISNTRMNYSSGRVLEKLGGGFMVWVLLCTTDC